MIGAEYSASWGRYRVHREDLDQVVLADVRSPSAFVVVTRAKLAAEYTLGASDVVAAPKSPGEASCGELPAGASSKTPPSTSRAWTPPPAKFDQPETLGAPIPRSDYHVPAVSHETGLYWLPCFRRLDGDRGQPHAWFVTAGAEFLCPACRGVDRVVEPAFAIPPPLEPETAARLRDVGAGVRAILRLWADPVGVHVRPVAQLAEFGGGIPEDACASQAGSGVHPVVVDRDVKPDTVRRCDDCGKKLGTAFFTGEHGFMYCGGCVQLSDHLREVLAMHRQGVTPLPRPLPARPAQRSTSPEERSDAKADVGSFDRPPPDEPRPPAAKRSTARELWPEYTREVER